MRKFALADGSEVTWTPPELTSSPGGIATGSDNRVYCARILWDEPNELLGR